MTAIKIANIEGIETIGLSEFAEKAYLDYSMYVILDRALPHIADGLKPVQRRIIYAMDQLALGHTAKHKKSARTVGDVLGKYHPHGDSACYEAMVLMAQPFSYRYPLVDGQGNWGSADDPKSFAAMRYTEARLTKFAEVLLEEIDKGTVDFHYNFDGTAMEPRLLPAKLPVVLLNGTTGIAVGMATDIPPHNANEVAEALLHLLDKPKATIEDICQYILAPDFASTAEIITPKAEILQIYKTGGGSIKARARYIKESGDIIITDLPQGASGAKILEQIASQMRAKKLPLISDLRDESDHENPTRLVIVPRSNRINEEELMQHLFATTELERSYRVNLNIIGVDERPKVYNLKLLLQEWLDWRKAVVTRRLNHRLEQVEDRLHILDGLLITYLNIDEVIKIIRNSDDAKKQLIKQFKLSDIQAEAILNIKLRQLAKLEEIKIRAEQDELSKERDSINAILGSEQKMKTLLKKEITEAKKLYGDARRSPLVERAEAKQLKLTEQLPKEAVTVILSKKGWIRAAKGHEIDVGKLSYKSGDSLLDLVFCRSDQSVILLDSTGRSYNLVVHNLPSARGYGEPVTGKLSPPSGASFVGMQVYEDDDKEFIVGSNAGFGFRVPAAALITKNKSGKEVVKLPADAKVLPLIAAAADSYVAMVTNVGRMLLLAINELPQLNKGKGNKLINIPTDKFKSHEEWVSAWQLVPAGAGLQLSSGKRNKVLKPKDLEHYIGSRGQRGHKLPRGFQSVNAIVVVE